MLRVLFCLLISFAAVNAQNNRLTADYFYGKWKECHKIVMSKNIPTVDSSFTCDAKWQYEFKSDGTYIENAFFKCKGKTLQETGSWRLEGDSITTHAKKQCPNMYAYPSSEQVIYINKNKWAVRGMEMDGIWVFTYFERVR